MWLKIMTKSFYSLFIISGLLVAGIAFGAGYYVGQENKPIVIGDNIVGAAVPADKKIDFDIFWKTWQILDQKFIPGVNATATNVSVAKNDQERVYGAISGLVNSMGDPYTVFMPPQEKKEFDQTIAGNFGGVGMEVGIRDGIITVVSPIEGTPAKRAGVLAGDKIIKINGSSTESLSIDQAVQKIRGDVGTHVKITVSRSNGKEVLDFDLTRETINVPVIKTEKDPSGVFIIRLFSFTATSPKLFQNALQEFSQSGADKLILDLRGNPGGYLEAAVDMASWFLPKGAVVVREIHRDDPEKDYQSAGYNAFSRNLKMVILVDGGSASASEILSGALREYGVAKLIGTKTFGKGSVQELIPITDDTSLKVTIARWLTPQGHSISQSGLDPDIHVEVLKEDVLKNYDRVQAAAIEYLTSGTTTLATTTAFRK